MSKFSAQPAALGYLYQVRYALSAILSAENDDTKLYIEALDDIDLTTNGTASELLQLKHSSLKRVANLTDKSKDFWKTIRVWSENVKQNLLDKNTRLKLITTAKVSNSSILSSFLLGNDTFIASDVEKKLLDIASSSSGKTLKSSFDAFKSLSSSQRLNLLDAIEIIDESPNILDLEGKIKAVHLPIPRKHRDYIYNQLEGWWFSRVIAHLNKKSSLAISKEEVIEKIWEIQKQYEDDNLPTEFLGEIFIPSEDETDQMIFVRQLQEIALKKPQISKAINDYYQAFEQRSRWHRESLLLVDELEKYEKQLIDEWERHRLWQEYDTENEDSQLKVGREIFKWVDEAKNFPSIRPKVTAPYVVRGSFHILANEASPRVWWHPKSQFSERLQSIITTSEPKSAWNQHPIEVANLLNPAFCSLLLRDTIKEYQQSSSTGLPYALLFLVLPIILHKSTREILPKSKTTKMNPWLNDNPSTLVGFPDRLISLKTITKESIFFGLTKGVISTDKQNAVFSVTKKVFRRTRELKIILERLDQAEVQEIQRQAKFIGRWFATVPSIAAIYTMWGIKP